MRSVKYLFVAAGAAAIGLLAGAGSAQASGCPSDQSVLDYSKNDPPYQCAVHYWSGKKSIAAWDTKSWSADTALGYNVESKCAYRSSSDVSWTWVGAGPSYSATFTNWATGTRHFGTGVIFTTGPVNGDQIKSNSNCATGDGKIQNAIKRITQNITLDEVQGNGGNSGSTLYFRGTVSPSSSTTGYAVLVIAGEPVTSNGQPVMGPIVDGKYTIAWQTPIIPTDVTLPVSVVFPGDTSQCPAAAKTCGSTPIGPTDPVIIRLKKSYSPMPVPDNLSASEYVTTSSNQLVDPVAPAEIGSVASGDQGATTSASGSPGVIVRQRSTRTPGKLGLQCPSGTVPMHAELSTGRSDLALAFGRRGVQLRPGVLPNGRNATIQLLCRRNVNSQFHAQRVSFGTARADRMSSRAKGATLFGGPGADRMVIAGKRGVALGGHGNDRITVRAANSVARGGPGNDVIRSTAAGRTLLIGGPGRDVIVATGKARVNVRDGERDRVICQGRGVRVLADSLDVLGRNCRRV